MRTLAIVGGGASGLAAAIAAKQTGGKKIRILIAERLPRVGKKILSTGNGRCNFTNLDLSPEHYHGDRAFAARVLERFGTRDALEFFESVGVPPYVEDGRVYPKSESAAGLLDALRFAADGCEIVENFAAERLIREGNVWKIQSADGRELAADAVVVAAGGRAAPSLGSDGSGLRIFRDLRYEITEMRPALVQLKVSAPSTAALKGVRVRARAAAICEGEELYSEEGEILFAEYGLSGIPIFQISARKPCDTVILDFLPVISKGEILDGLRRRREILADRTAEDFFVGMLNRRVGNMILRAAGVEKLSTQVRSLGDDALERIAEKLKRFDFLISGSMGWQNAQVTAGGVAARQFSPDTLESRRDRGLYAAGEILDVHGDCGGYNLHWAWATGNLAGRAAARALLEG